MCLYINITYKSTNTQITYLQNQKREKSLTKILYRFPSSSASIFIAFAPGTLFFEKEKLISNIHNLTIFSTGKGKFSEVI